MNKEKVNQYIKQYLAEFKSSKMNKWNYEDGYVLLGAIQIYYVTKEAYLKDFVLHYLEKYITDSGEILYYQKENYNIDDIFTGRILFFAYRETQKEKFMSAIIKLVNQLKEQSRTNFKNFSTKKSVPNQILLVDSFMAQPFYMMYETQVGIKEHYKDIVNQFQNCRRFLYNETTGLYHSGYEDMNEEEGQRKGEGNLGNYQLYSIGSYLLAIIDTMEEMSEQIYEYYHELKVLFKEALAGLLAYQGEDLKAFYPVIHTFETKENYLDVAGFAMISAAIIKACRMRVLLSEKYEQIGVELLESLTDNNSLEKYLTTPSKGDTHICVGATMMAYGQWLHNNCSSKRIERC